jgi:hypothetical protein
MATQVVPFTQVTAATALQQTAFPAVAVGMQGKWVAELHVQPAAGNYSYISVVDVATGIVLKDLFPPPATGIAESWCLHSDPDEDGVDPTRFAVLFQHAGDKWNAYAVVR